MRAAHHHLAIADVIEHVCVFVVTLVLSAATTFIIGAALIGQL
jgi:hypothetical protein